MIKPGERVIVNNGPAAGCAGRVLSPESANGAPGWRVRLDHPLHMAAGVWREVICPEADLQLAPRARPRPAGCTCTTQVLWLYGCRCRAAVKSAE
jgi:hypothetical protein